MNATGIRSAASATTERGYGNCGRDRRAMRVEERDGARFVCDSAAITVPPISSTGAQ